MKNGSVYTPPRYLCSTFWAFVLLVAFFVFSCSNLQKENDSLSVEIQIPIEQLQKSAYMQSNLLENKTILSVAVTLFVNEIPTTQSAEGSVLELSKKIFLFRGISIGSKLRAFAQVFQNGNLICQGESQEIRLGYVQNALRIEMKIVDNAPSAPPTHVHNWDAGVITTEPTTTDDGVKTFTCSECGQTKTEVVPALGHSHNVATDWTYDETNHWHAADCGIATHIFAVDTHDGYWDAGTVTTPATCTAVGEKEFACTVCGFKKTETIPVTGHSWATSYISDTDYHWHKCDNCSEIDGKTAHVWDAGTVTTESTTTATGVMTYTCICGFEKTEVIPRLVFLMSGFSFNSAISNKADIEKVVFGLLRDNSIKDVVTSTAVAATKVDVGANADTYGAYYDSADKTLYIVPTDENAISIMFNESSSLLFSGFSNCKSIEGLDLVDTSKVTNMGSMFNECTSLISVDLSGFDTSSVTDMGSMFYGCSGLTSLDLSNFNTSNVTTMRSMFARCSALTSINLSSFNTDKVSDMGTMFYQCSNLTSLDLSNFNTDKVENMQGMFISCKLLTSLDLSSFDTTKVTNMGSMFNECTSLISVDLSGFDTSSVTDMGSMFEECSSLTSVDLSGFDTSSVTDMSSMFNECSSLTSVAFSGIDTSKVHNMDRLFNECTSLISVDLSGFDTSSVTNMSRMFYGCSGLASLDLSNFNTSNVTNMEFMFYGCEKLAALDLNNFNTANVSAMKWMFTGCSSLTSLDLSNFDTANVTDMSQMFSGCSNLTSLVLSSFDTANVTDMSGMFTGCSSLTSLDLSKFDTANVRVMSYMFSVCSGLTSLDLSTFNTANVTDMNSMFYSCTNLATIYVHYNPVTNFIPSGCTTTNMFTGCAVSRAEDLAYK